MATKNVNKGFPEKKRLHMTAKMGTRCVEIRPVNAWVQVEPVTKENYQEATVLAQIEDQKLRVMQQEKMEKLKKFQEEVKQRVQVLTKLKHQQQLQKSYRDVEMERNIVNQSAFAAEKTTPRKNSCTLRTDKSLAIQHSPKFQAQGTGACDSDQENECGQFEEQNLKVHRISKHARHHLGSRKLMSDNLILDDLPGGIWREGPTRDHPSSRHMAEPQVIDIEEAEETPESVTAEQEGYVTQKEYTGKKYVQFAYEDPADELLIRGRTRPDHSITSSKTNKSEFYQPSSIPDIYPGVQSEDEKKRISAQRALFRRLFMDIEREQVKESQRRREHRKRIHQLKREKEDERRQVEQQAQRLVEPRDPITGVSQLDIVRQKLEEERSMMERQQEQHRRQQKTRETERYLEALKRNLMEKIEKQNVTLPALCCCGSTVWDTNPDTCANNCVFYKNHRAYAKALQSLLASCDVV